VVRILSQALVRFPRLPRRPENRPEIRAFRVSDSVSALLVQRSQGGNRQKSPALSGNIPVLRRLLAETGLITTAAEDGIRTNMRFVETKTPEQQGGLMLHRTRNLFVRQQTAVINAIRAHLAEFGIVAPVGRRGVEALLNVAADRSDKRMPEAARACLAALGAQLQMLKTQILQSDRLIMAWHRSNETSKRLDDIPGVGPALATALVASVANPKAFRSGRDFSAWIGLVPRQHSSGGKDRLGSISKRGDRYLRGLFVAGALAVIRYAKIYGTEHRP
jgi:transposase